MTNLKIRHRNAFEQMDDGDGLRAQKFQQILTTFSKNFSK